MPRTASFDGDGRQFTAPVVATLTARAGYEQAIVTVGDATSANHGRLREWSNDIGRLWVGPANGDRGDVTGDTAGDAKQITTLHNLMASSIPLAGSGVDDVGRTVYLLTDSNTYSFTPPSSATGRAVPVGWMSEYISATRIRVQTFDGWSAIQMTPTRINLCIGLARLSGTDDAITLVEYEVPFHALVSRFYLRCIKAGAGASATGTAVLNVQKQGSGSNVPVTHGALTISTVNSTLYARLDPAAQPSAANRVHQGDLLRLVHNVTADGTFTDGLHEVWATFELQGGH